MTTTTTGPGAWDLEADLEEMVAAWDRAYTVPARPVPTTYDEMTVAELEQEHRTLSEAIKDVLRGFGGDTMMEEFRAERLTVEAHLRARLRG